MLMTSEKVMSIFLFFQKAKKRDPIPVERERTQPGGEEL